MDNRVEPWLNKIHEMDCLDGMAQMPPRCIDLVIADPPFTLGIGSVDSKLHPSRKLDNWSDLLNSASFFKDVFQELQRICRPNSIWWFFSSWKTFAAVQKAAANCLIALHSVLIWDKDWIGPSYPGLRPTYELVLLFCHGDGKIINRSARDIQTFKWTANKPWHPAEKPLPLIKWLIHNSSTNKTILDPFIGSGTTAVAAKHLKKDYIGFELNPHYIKIANERIKQESLSRYVTD